jgi:glycosyltransferase involved in cell wall biosynthesis
MSLSVAVVTCTIGRKDLEEAIQSVKEQTRTAKHYVFVHGEEYRERADEVLSKHRDVIPVYLPYNNNNGGYGMAPVYALAPYVVREDVICFLDDDNWFEPTHVEETVGLIEEHGLDWAYSLRNIVAEDRSFICQDNCESLGVHPNASGQLLVDNSCFVVKNEHAKAHSHAWYVKFTSDRSFMASMLRAKLKVGATGKHTTNYRISTDTPVSMPVENFLGNNKYMEAKFGAQFPWMQRAVFDFKENV